MHGFIGKLHAVPEARDARVDILLGGVSWMHRCLSCVVAHDPSDADAIWVTEVWESEHDHLASLHLASVGASVGDAIARSRPRIAGFGGRFVTPPVGWSGLARKG